uniref:Uncharacterized protein n=1 Tax=Sphaerodactylus townsendi TaxID=933632 RepID=A0ACB8EL50_9SAUR
MNGGRGAAALPAPRISASLPRSGCLARPSRRTQPVRDNAGEASLVGGLWGKAAGLLSRREINPDSGALPVLSAMPAARGRSPASRDARASPRHPGGTHNSAEGDRRTRFTSLAPLCSARVMLRVEVSDV